MISKKIILLFMIASIIGITSSTLQNAQAFSLQDITLKTPRYGYECVLMPWMCIWDVPPTKPCFTWQCLKDSGG